MNILRKLKNKTVKVGVVGLGYVGLPLVKELAKQEILTFGFDISEKKVKTLNNGESYILDVSSREVKELVDAGFFKATSNFARLKNMDVIFICVPTPFTKAKAPDISFIEAATESIRKTLKKGQLIVLQSTTYPGTTEEVVLPILEKTGLKAGKDFYLAFSPERIDPGNRKFSVKNTPKVVGGINRISTDLACRIFSLIIDKDKIFAVSSPKSAEMCKLLENTFRSVNIALVNELTLLCARMNINIWEVIQAASTKPFGYMPFYPGPGVGGHCIPVDPYYLSWKAREFDFLTNFIELAAEINQSMPNFTVDKITAALNDCNKCIKGAKILVLGAAFKPDIEDARNSAAVEVIKILLGMGGDVFYNDPFVAEINMSEQFSYTEFPKIILKSKKLTSRLLSSADCVLLAVKHSVYDYAFIAQKAKLIVDAVNGFAKVNSKYRKKIVHL